MKTSALFVLCGLLVLGGLSSPTTTYATEKAAIAVKENYTFFALPFTFSERKSQIVVPTVAKRDIATSTSVGFTLKTPEGLRQSAGQAVGMVVKDQTSSEYVLYVLYKDTTPTSRISTLSISHLPFLLVSDKTGTSSQALNQNELRTYSVTNANIKALTDSE